MHQCVTQGKPLICLIGLLLFVQLIKAQKIGIRWQTGVQNESDDTKREIFVLRRMNYLIKRIYKGGQSEATRRQRIKDLLAAAAQKSEFGTDGLPENIGLKQFLLQKGKGKFRNGLKVVKAQQSQHQKPDKLRCFFSPMSCF